MQFTVILFPADINNTNSGMWTTKDLQRSEKSTDIYGHILLFPVDYTVTLSLLLFALLPFPFCFMAMDGSEWRQRFMLHVELSCRLKDIVVGHAQCEFVTGSCFCKNSYPDNYGVFDMFNCWMSSQRKKMFSKIFKHNCIFYNKSKTIIISQYIQWSCTPSIFH